MTEEQQALYDLLGSAGWLMFRQHVRSQWGPEGYARRLKQAVTQALQADKSAEAAIAAIDLANNEIDQLQAWPAMRLKQLEDGVARDAAVPAISRRGPNL